MIEKIFKAYDVRATYPNPLNEESAWKVGHATAQFLKRSRQNVPADQRLKREDAIVVGRDMRPSSPDLAKSLTDGIRSAGLKVVGQFDRRLIELDGSPKPWSDMALITARPSRTITTTCAPSSMRFRTRRFATVWP